MKTSILWFRQDLRLADNLALLAAVAASEQLIPVYIHKFEEEHPWAAGSASRWWLHHSLTALDKALRALGSRLVILQGDEFGALRRLIAHTDACGVYWNRRYEPAAVAADKEIKSALREEGVVVETFNAQLLNEPWAISREGGQPYRVFTPYWKAVQKHGSWQLPSAAPVALPPMPADVPGIKLGALKLLPSLPWDGGLRDFWVPGAMAAAKRLAEFLTHAIGGYADDRDRPDLPGTSRLAPYLHFGEISPRQIVHAVRDLSEMDPSAFAVKGSESFLRELSWREFAYHLLYHFPSTVDRPLDDRFDRFMWVSDYQQELIAWQQGRTGYPLVDSGMRELWHTGWMHNRVRMVVGSFLTKNLLIPWQEGARWFWDTLVDADLANNTLGWQWIAGCGADAAPFFRVFNPVMQGERFDPNGDYVRRWLPALNRLPSSVIHKPWCAAPGVLEMAGLKLGTDYPLPIVDLAQSRTRALEAYARMKQF